MNVNALSREGWRGMVDIPVNLEWVELIYLMVACALILFYYLYLPWVSFCSFVFEDEHVLMDMIVFPVGFRAARTQIQKMLLEGFQHKLFSLFNSLAHTYLVITLLGLASRPGWKQQLYNCTLDFIVRRFWQHSHAHTIVYDICVCRSRAYVSRKSAHWICIYLFISIYYISQIPVIRSLALQLLNIRICVPNLSHKAPTARVSSTAAPAGLFIYTYYNS